jgi:uncharacterized protein YbjT (DUF2867 family)
VNVLVFGATGMIGQGVVRECLRDPAVKSVVCVGRSGSGQTNPKVRDVVTPDLATLAPVERQLAGADACFFSLGVTALGLTEAQYTAITYDLTLAIAKTLARINPAITFIYVSGQSTDSTEKGSVMWARVKGRTENALLALPLKAYMFRPGAIIPLDGITSRTGWYNAFYVVARPLYPLLKRLAPNSITDTRKLGRAMIAVAARGDAKRILETPDINRLGS